MRPWRLSMRGCSRKFLRVALSFGSGMSKWLWLNGIEGMSFSLARGGTGLTQGGQGGRFYAVPYLCARKRASIFWPRKPEEEALALYYKSLIEYVLENVVAEFVRQRSKFSLPRPIPIIVSGETSSQGTSSRSSIRCLIGTFGSSPLKFLRFGRFLTR